MKRSLVAAAAVACMAVASCRYEIAAPPAPVPAAPAAAREVAFPADFPKAVGPYPGSTVTGAAVGGDATNATLRTADPLDKVVAWYKKTLKDADWEIGSAVEDPEGAVFSVRKGNQTVVIVATAAEGATTVSLTMKK